MNNEQDKAAQVQKECGGCHGSGWMVRDPDIGTEQECFSCGGSGIDEDASPVAQDEREFSHADFLRGRFLTDIGMRAFLNGDSIEFYPEQLKAVIDAARAATPAQDKQASPEELLAIARKTGLRTHMHGVDATHAKQMLADFVAALPAGSQDKQDAVDDMREALDESQSLLVSMLLEDRPKSEIEEQIILNRAALDAAMQAQGAKE